MSDREKMLKLLDDCFEKEYTRRGLITAWHTADYLLANGVTFAKDTDAPSKWELDLSCLTPRERTAIQMCYEDASSLTDIAVELELNYNRAAYVLDKARKKLFKNIRITNRSKQQLPEPLREGQE